MAAAAFLLFDLILSITFSLLLSRELVKDEAAILATLAMGSATSTWNSLWISWNSSYWRICLAL